MVLWKKEDGYKVAMSKMDIATANTIVLFAVERKQETIFPIRILRQRNLKSFVELDRLMLTKIEIEDQELYIETTQARYIVRELKPRRSINNMIAKWNYYRLEKPQEVIKSYTNSMYLRVK